jgi:hypothetical protein
MLTEFAESGVAVLVSIPVELEQMGRKQMGWKQMGWNPFLCKCHPVGVQNCSLLFVSKTPTGWHSANIGF